MSVKMLAAGAGSAVVSGHGIQSGIIVALAVLVPLVLYGMHRLFGDLVPAVIMLGTAAFVIWVLPSVPHSPVACLAAHGKDPCTGTQLDWLAGLAFVLPAALAVAYKTRRGDGRGVTGTRPVFRRRPK